MTKPPSKTIRVITIDGPSGSGKSTAARKLAQRLGFAYLDTGAMYRAVTLQALAKGVDLKDSGKLIDLAKELNLELVAGVKGTRVLVEGEDVTDQIRSVEVTENAHFVASRRGVRDEMVQRQRRLGRKLGPLVTEGRDQGTVVFPDAQVKFFLDADAGTRARRRYEQLVQAGEEISYEQVLASIEVRDARDTSRNTAPLEVPAGAIIVDTSNMSVAEMIDELVEQVERVGLTVEERPGDK